MTRALGGDEHPRRQEKTRRRRVEDNGQQAIETPKGVFDI
jgi:hypothetical protein